MNGNIRCILPVIDDKHFLISIELPLERLCVLSQYDYFDEDTSFSKDISLNEEKSSDSDVIDLTHLRSRAIGDKNNPLIILKRKQQVS